MVATLRGIWAEALRDPLPYFHLNRRRVELWREDLARVEEARSPEARFLFAYELLSAGEVDEAIPEIVRLLPASGSGGYSLTSSTKPAFDLLGVAYLRQGIRRNCLGDERAEACLLPIPPGSTHRWQQGARRAIALYEQLLEAFPDDLGTRWLRNLASMMLGQYPDAVPDRWRIPGLAASAASRVRRFPNVAPALGLAVDGMSGGVDLEDFDGDGLVDVFVTAYGLMDPVQLFLADGHGGFVDRTHAAGLDGMVGGLNVVHADYDNDGDADILILRGAWLGSHGVHPNSLLRNNGDGTFEDVTAAAGLLSFHPTQAAAWADFNTDGFLDLFIGNESGEQFLGMGGRARVGGSSAVAPAHPAELFVNNGDGTFTDVAATLGLDLEAFIKGAAWGDIDNDGLPDLFVSVLGEPNRLYLNRGGTTVGDWRFEEVGTAAGVREPLFSFPCWFWDFDNDGWEDLFVASFDPRPLDAVGDVTRQFLGLEPQGEKTRLFRNRGDGTFEDVAPRLGLDGGFYAMGANYGDLDNDGFLDVYLGTGTPDLRALIPNRMFHNRGGMGFDDVTFDGGFGHLAKGHGIAFADLDRDGDQDIYAVMGGAVEGDAFPNAVFENPNSSPENAWVVLMLEGLTANRSAIGARLRFAVEDENGLERVIHATVSTGGSFGASSLQQEMGLGPATHIRELRVTWPNRDRTVEVYPNLEVNRYYEVVEGGGVRPVARPPVRLGGLAATSDTLASRASAHPARTRRATARGTPRRRRRGR